MLQVIEWTTLGFGPASGGYASVFIGWTAFYAVFTLGVRVLDRDPGRDRVAQRAARASASAARGRRGDDRELLSAGIEACSFFWTFYVAIGVVAFVILYLV